MPSLELLLAQPADRQKAVIGNAPVKIAIEAAVRWGWDAVIGQDGEFIGMHGFGASAPAKDLFKHFGITAEAAVNAALKALGLTVEIARKKDYVSSSCPFPPGRTGRSAVKHCRGAALRGDGTSY